MNLAKKIDSMIDVWCDSMPNMQTDPPCTWDDVVTNRLVYFELIEERYLNSVCLKDSDASTSYLGDSTINNFDEDLLNFSKKIKKKMSKTNFLMKIKFAQAAQCQGNYKLALNKLQQTRSILKVKNLDLSDLQLVWVHCYLNTHLYRCKQVNNVEISFKMFFDSMVIREILKYDSLAERFRNNQKNFLYEEQRVLHSKFTKFIIDSFIELKKDSDSPFQSILQEEKNINQLNDYIKNENINDVETVRKFFFIF